MREPRGTWVQFGGLQLGGPSYLLLLNTQSMFRLHFEVIPVFLDDVIGISLVVKSILQYKDITTSYCWISEYIGFKTSLFLFISGSCKDFSTPKRYCGLTQTFPGNDPSNAQLLEALRHSQTRAIEAENAYNEKEHIITLFFRLASQVFAYKQWLQLLQINSFSLQLTYKNQPIYSLLPARLPWVPYKGMQVKKAEHKVVKQKKSSLKYGAGRSTTAFLVGLSLAGAGLLLGWTMGWLLPST